MAVNGRLASRSTQKSAGAGDGVIWLTATDIFSDVMHEPRDIFAEQSTQTMFKQAFS
jgi:hypothetical protein